MRMVQLPKNVMDALEKCKPFPIATSSKDGVPNAGYVGAVKLLDNETLLVANNYMKKTLANIEENPIAAIVVWDAENKESYQVKFTVENVHSGELFEQFREEFKKYPVHSMLVMKPIEVYNSMRGKAAGERIA